MDTSTQYRRACAAAAAALIAFGAAACGGSDDADDDPTGEGTSASPSPSAAPSEPAAAITTDTDDELGEYLVDRAGMALYLFTEDGENTSTCYDECAVTWPPVLSDTAEVAAGGSVDAALLGTAERTEGTLQVTYDGHPLYYYADDLESGETEGQGFNDVWFVVAPDGSANKRDD